MGEAEFALAATADVRAIGVACLNGNDPITSRPVMREIIEGLTQGLVDTAPDAGSDRRTTPRFLEPAGEDELHELFLSQRWTDPLPIVLPTEARVAAMLRGTSRSASAPVLLLNPITARQFVERVASCHGATVSIEPWR